MTTLFFSLMTTLFFKAQNFNSGRPKFEGSYTAWPSSIQIITCWLVVVKPLLEPIIELPEKKNLKRNFNRNTIGPIKENLCENQAWKLFCAELNVLHPTP